MSSNAVPISDYRPYVDQALGVAAKDDVAAPKGKSLVPFTAWKRDIAGARAAHNRNDAAAIDLLEAAVAAASEELRDAATATARLAAGERRARTCIALAEARLERLDLEGGARMYREAIACFPEAEPERRWRYGQIGGGGLRRFAALLGRSDAAALAVDMFRQTLPNAPDQAEAQKLLGMACTTLGELSFAAEPLNEALAAYTASLDTTAGRSDSGAAAFRCGVQINKAVALWLRGFLAKDEEQKKHDLDAAESLLRETLDDPVLSSPPMDKVDWPRAQDNLGNVLMELGRTEEAIKAYEAAAVRWADDDERARTFNNLGTAYAAANRPDDALEAFRKALRRQLRDTSPLAWARIKHNQGSAFRLLARHEQARQAFMAAREARRRDWSPVLWAATTVALGQVEEETGHSIQAFDLYVEALPDLLSAQKEVLIDHVIELIPIYVSNMLQSGMAKRPTLVEEIKGLFLDRGIAPDQWAARLAQVTAELTNQSPLPAAESRRRRGRYVALALPQESLQLTDDQLAQTVAQRVGMSGEDAKKLLDAAQVDPAVMIGASEKLLKPKSRFFTRSDFSDEELNDPQKIGAAKTTVNLHRRDHIENLDEETAYELRRATALLRYSKYQPHPRVGLPISNLVMSGADTETPAQAVAAAAGETTKRAAPETSVFRNLPEALARPYSKEPVPDEVLTPENISTAYRIQNAIKRKRPAAALIDDADAYMAGRILRAHRERSPKGKTATHG